MLTLKHVTHSGEALYCGSEVSYSNGINEAAIDAEQVMYLDGREWKSLRRGTVYVMNDAGKTVATYFMGPLGVMTAGVAA